MTDTNPNNSSRLDRIEQLVEANVRIIEANAIQANERMNRIDERLEANAIQADERMNRIDERLDRIAVFAQDERIARAEADNQLREIVARMANAMGQFSQTVGQLSQTVNALSEDVRSLTAEMDQLRAMMMTHLREQHGGQDGVME